MTTGNARDLMTVARYRDKHCRHFKFYFAREISLSICRRRSSNSSKPSKFYFDLKKETHTGLEQLESE
ncbi:hypothetical protein R3I93_016291 [Phoxinus phoxinus]|uniref:Uncharacterized protein n=1 Tax=Phoxinus phoxinus TaxID=58324 RepID=A0AAN9CM60_9TELE